MNKILVSKPNLCNVNIQLSSVIVYTSVVVVVRKTMSSCHQQKCIKFLHVKKEPSCEWQHTKQFSFIKCFCFYFRFQVTRLSCNQVNAFHKAFRVAGVCESVRVCQCQGAAPCVTDVRRQATSPESVQRSGAPVPCATGFRELVIEASDWSIAPALSTHWSTGSGH